LAGRVKREPILVIMGNPPYSGISSNINAWTEELLKKDLDGAQSYYKVDGQPLRERNPKWLQDDYVKFLRFAQWKIQKAGQGIVAMITNHSYLDNPTFRGMRQSLMKTFDEIYILDLHGNSLKKETTPDGSPDENVFDIRQGVAIVVFVKNNQGNEHKIFHRGLFGNREYKYEWLREQAFSENDYEKLSPISPYYFFVPSKTKEISHYLDWMKINEIFPVNSVGIVTSRDKFVIDENRIDLQRKLDLFTNLSLSDEIIKPTCMVKDTSDWKIGEARKELALVDDQGLIKEILYRPFDKRYIIYHKAVIERMRSEVMRHMLKDNIGLVVGRQGKVVGENFVWNLAFITDSVIDFNLFYRGGGLCLPLYLYNDTYDRILLNIENIKEPNISPKILKFSSNQYSHLFPPETILSYVYAILYSNIYRETYADFLKFDFPRVPFTADGTLFHQMAALGKHLIDLHLLRSAELEQPIARFEGQGEDLTITMPKYDPKTNRVWINATHYLEGIPPEVWQYQIGGYQVLDKYLKGRKGRSLEDPRHILRVATALAKTIEVQHEIDALYPQVEEKLIVF